MKIGILGWILSDGNDTHDSIINVVKELSSADLVDVEFLVCGTSNTVESQFTKRGVKAGLNMVCIDMVKTGDGRMTLDHGFSRVVKTDETDKLEVMKSQVDYIYTFGNGVKEKHMGLSEMDNVEYF